MPIRIYVRIRVCNVCGERMHVGTGQRAFRPGTAGTEKGAAAGFCDYGIARLWGRSEKMILVVDCITYQGWRSVRRDVCLKYGGSMSGTGDSGWCVFK